MILHAQIVCLTTSGIGSVLGVYHAIFGVLPLLMALIPTEFLHKLENLYGRQRRTYLKILGVVIYNITKNLNLTYINQFIISYTL
jgi:uncharacterized membrane protein YhiD involved in acid resistance